jgi:hypothetical protein
MMIRLIDILDWLFWLLRYRQLPYQGPHAPTREIYRSAAAQVQLQQIRRFERTFAVPQARLRSHAVGP